MLILTAWEEDERMILKTDLLDISIQADYLSRDPPQETPEAVRGRLVQTLSRPGCGPTFGTLCPKTNTHRKG